MEERLSPHATILNVDDHEPARYAKSRMLARAGYEVLEAGTGTRALEIVGTRRPDLVLLDVKLPDIDGYEVCRRIRSNPATATIAVLQTSASFVDLQARVRALDEGADSYLSAPFEPEALIASVRALLRMRRAESELVETREAFRATFEQAPVAIGHVAPDGRWLRVNGRLSALLGSRSQTGGSMLDCLLPAERPRVAEGLARLAAREIATFAVEQRLECGPDAVHDVSLTASLVESPQSSAPRYLIVLLEDITDRRRAESALARHRVALHESEERFRQFADNSRDVVWIFDVRTQRHEYVSAAFCEIWGFDPAEVLASPERWIDTIDVADREAVSAAMAKALGGDVVGVEYRIRRPDGELRWIDYRGFPIRDANGEVHRVAGIAQDISARKAADESRRLLLESERSARIEAVRASQVKDQFVATLSHELRTPLNAILGWTELLRSGEPDLERYAEALEVIERNARAQARLIEDLLDVSRIVSGKIRLDVKPIDLAAIVEAALEAIRPAATAKGVAIRTRIGAVPGEVCGDAERLQQVVWNLASNALKFTPREGTLEIAVEGDVKCARIVVRDTGQGISPEFLPHIFDAFRQADASLTRRHGGLGLGLSIVRSLVELHGGRVSAVSEGIGRGATFQVELPIGEAPPLARAEGARDPTLVLADEPPSEEPPVSLCGVRILLVDDEADAREFVRRMLVERGATVCSLGSAREALASRAEFDADVLVSDIGMPEMDGYEMLRLFRDEDARRSKRIPAVALTAYARAEDSERALREGYDHHLAKPVRPADLVGAIAAAARAR